MQHTGRNATTRCPHLDGSEKNARTDTFMEPFTGHVAFKVTRFHRQCRSYCRSMTTYQNRLHPQISKMTRIFHSPASHNVLQGTNSSCRPVCVGLRVVQSPTHAIHPMVGLEGFHNHCHTPLQRIRSTLALDEVSAPRILEDPICVWSRSCLMQSKTKHDRDSHVYMKATSYVPILVSESVQDASERNCSVTRLTGACLRKNICMHGGAPSQTEETTTESTQSIVIKFIKCPSTRRRFIHSDFYR